MMAGRNWRRCMSSIRLPLRSRFRPGARSDICALSTDALSSDGKKKLATSKFDAIVVGGGHNGLTAAAYLARAGVKVVVLEKRAVLGGAAVTEEIIPGFKFSRCSYVQSLLRPVIIRDLQLHKHGLKLLPREPSSFTPTVDGKSLLLGADLAFNQSQISKFSKRDASAYRRQARICRYTEQLERFCAVMDPLLDTVPPERRLDGRPWQKRIREQIAQTKLLSGLVRRLAALGRSDTLAFMELLLAPASKVLDRWFESDVLKAALATDAVIGAMASVKSPGTGYVLLHHVMGETSSDKRAWTYVEGGMGAVSAAIAGAAVEAGATLFTNAEVKQFKLKDVTEVKGVSKAVVGVMLADGTEVSADKVLSNATPHVTFQKLLPANVLPDDFLSRVKTIDYKSGTTKINVAVDRLPLFSACKSATTRPGPEHQGTIHIGADCMQELDDAYRDALSGQPSRRPLVELTIPSVVDRTIAPPGKHVINMFVQYTPYQLAQGSWQDQEIREDFANRCFSLVDEYAPGFSSSVLGYDMLTPPDLENIFGLTGGNIFHGEMGLDSLFLLRPFKGWSDYRTPLAGLYLCGSGAHPGGGVMGAPGRNASHVVLQDMKR
ncbi:hypothetical protein R1sor_018637 [Riccia sorocarpa]|uniref:Pyridine nucleotide-disulfide oxidoreductase domain-containing protein 2 n=1 Tax=Riccia sorocarpa TaxID=122646 RepID=A0ABD3IDU2_9MARC